MSKDAGEYQYWSRKANCFDAANTYIVGEKTLKAAQSWLKDQLKAEDSALEIGCGTGIFSTVIAEIVQHLTATDMSAEMLAKAKLRLRVYPNTEVKPADGNQITFTESAFDAVFMGNVLHIVRNPVTILRECHRILKQGGRMISIDYTMAGMPMMAKLAMGMRYVSKLGIPPRENKSYRSEGLANLLQQAGFEIKDAQTITRETNVICLNAVKR
jgi:ubiquinone/menaquinone biosynthesis C-methylase UbiE